MPDFNRVHELASKLAQLTAPGQREPGLATWNRFVGETWETLVALWDDKAVAASELYEALKTEDDYEMHRPSPWHVCPAHTQANCWEWCGECIGKLQIMRQAALAKARGASPDAR